MGPRGGRSCRTARTLTAAAKALGFKKVEPGCQPRRARTCTTARSSRSTTRPASSSPMSAARTTTRPRRKPEFQPQYDVVGKGYRQPGSAFKPFNYAVGIDDRTITAGTMLMDSRDRFRRWLHAERRRQARARPGPRPERPAVLPQHPVRQGDGLNTPDHVFTKAQEFGMTLPGRDGRRNWRSPWASRRSGRSTW